MADRTATTAEAPTKEAPPAEAPAEKVPAAGAPVTEAPPPDVSESPGPPPAIQPAQRKGPEAQLTEVRFKGKRRDFFTSYTTPGLGRLEYVVVEADRGQDLGVVASLGDLAKKKCAACEGCNEANLPTARVLRRAAPVDVERMLKLREEEDEIRRDVRGMATEHRLKMKISDAEWQWDRNKLIIYFTADKRVDFRALVRSLAKKYRTRIELKQIGVRDEAKRLDGVGRCGRELCSSNWLPELKPVTLQLAKDQKLSLNPSQISGACGRLMCSLRYEHDFYVQARKRFPKAGRQLQTTSGNETVESIDIFGELITLRSESGEVRAVKLKALKREIAEARRKK